MPFTYKLSGSYHEDNPYKEGDTIRWKYNNEIMTVGDDWEELLKWGNERDYIVTTSGRVLSITEIEKV